MMGKSKKTQPKLFYHGLSLEQRMPKDDPLRKIKQLLDFDFIRSQVADLYGNNGNKTIEPAVILKLMFLLFYENVSSERALMRKLPLRMDWLWFCDYDIDEETPDHSVLTEENSGQDKVEKAVSPADPDARIGRKYGKSTLGYKDHRVVNDKHGVITTTISTPANLNDSNVLKQAVHTHQANTATKVRTVTADKVYGTFENYKFLNNKVSKACIPHPRYGCRKVGKFSYDMFKYDKHDDCFVCPAGQKLLRYNHKKPDDGRWRYHIERKVCQGCKFLSQCLTSKTRGRQVSRNLNAEYVEWSDGCLSRHERKQLMSRRQYKV